MWMGRDPAATPPSRARPVERERRDARLERMPEIDGLARIRSDGNPIRDRCEDGFRDLPPRCDDSDAPAPEERIVSSRPMPPPLCPAVLSLSLSLQPSLPSAPPTCTAPQFRYYSPPPFYIYQGCAPEEINDSFTKRYSAWYNDYISKQAQKQN